MLVRIFYLSELTGDVSDVVIQAILGAAQMRNRRLDVTGMLAQSDGHFAQVLEGRPDAVAEVMARVERDPHHRRVRVLLQESIARRQFDRWAMGLVRRDDMAPLMKRLHAEGCATPAEARRAIAALLSDAPESGN